MTQEREITVSEAAAVMGRLGGARTLERHGRTFYAKIGKKGGETVAKRRGPAFYSAIGKKGGNALWASRGPAYYRAIGRAGGLVNKAKPGYFTELVRKRWAKREEEA